MLHEWGKYGFETPGFCHSDSECSTHKQITQVTGGINGQIVSRLAKLYPYCFMSCVISPTLQSICRKQVPLSFRRTLQMEAIHTSGQACISNTGAVATERIAAMLRLQQHTKIKLLPRHSLGKQVLALLQSWSFRIMSHGEHQEKELQMSDLRSWACSHKQIPETSKRTDNALAETPATTHQYSLHSLKHTGPLISVAKNQSWHICITT